MYDCEGVFLLCELCPLFLLFTVENSSPEGENHVLFAQRIGYERLCVVMPACPTTCICVFYILYEKDINFYSLMCIGSDRFSTSSILRLYDVI